MTAQPRFNPRILVEHGENLVWLIDRRCGIVNAITIEGLVVYIDALRPTICLKPEAVILKAGPRAFVEPNIMLIQPRAFVDSSPVLHADIKKVEVLLGVQYDSVIALFIANAFALEVLDPVLIRG